MRASTCDGLHLPPAVPAPVVSASLHIHLSNAIISLWGREKINKDALIRFLQFFLKALLTGFRKIIVGNEVFLLVFFWGGGELLICWLEGHQQEWSRANIHVC